MAAKKKINPLYRKKIEQIAIDNEDYASEEMKPVYQEQKKALDSLHVIVGALFIAYAINGLLKMTEAQKASTGIKDTLKTMGKDLGDSEVSKVTDILSKTYADTYYKNAFVMDEGLKVDLKFDLLKQEYIDAAVNAKFKEELFSDRIWTNKAVMIDKLHTGFVDAMKGDTTIDKLASDIKNTFNVTAYESSRLVRTENARIQIQAQYDIGINTGVEQVMWSATLDGLTCAEDAELDGKVFPIDEAPECPAHPNCRCDLINMPYAGWTPTQRKDNETKDLIDYKDYATWAKDKGVD